jgi:hypothetical protein
MSNQRLLVCGGLAAVMLAGTAELQPAAANVEASGSVTVTVASPPPPPPPRYRRRPGPRIMLPLQIDIGAIGTSSDRGTLTGAEVAVGVHWASLSPKPTNFDIGLGVVASVMQPGDATGADPDDDVSFVGAYAGIAQTLSHGDFWRTWAGVRGEYLDVDAFGERRTGIGAAARLSAELFLSGVGIEPRGIFFGTYALGLYVEAGARQLGPDVGKLQVSGGLTLRTPLVWTWGRY